MKLFRKLLKKGLPSVVVRMMIFIYREQEAWVRWGFEKSAIFRISNGTRQGSVLSPALFAVYIDDLLQDLRKLGLPRKGTNNPNKLGQSCAKLKFSCG